MKLAPATLLILGMFGSFGIILAVMIAVFQPKSPPPAPAKPPAGSQQPQPVSQAPSFSPVDAAADAPSETTRVGPPPTGKPVAPVPMSIQNGRRLYRELEREKEEMARLRVVQEKMLQNALAEQQKKLQLLARRCEPLEPGEAALILAELSDEDLSVVLRHMQSEKLAPLIPILKDLGREKAIPILYLP